MAEKKKPEVSNYNFITVLGWMRNILKLSGNDLIIYSIIYGFSQERNQWCSASQEYLAEWSGASLITVKRTIKNLVDKGYIKKRYFTNDMGRWCEYKAIFPDLSEYQNDTSPKYQNDTTPKYQNDQTKYQNDTSLSIKTIPASIDNIEDNIEDNIGGKYDGRSRPSAPRKKFEKPTVEEVAAYIREKHYNVDAQRFIDYYDSNGWKVGKNPMRNWKAAVSTWEHNGYSNNSSTRNSTGCGNNNPEGFDEIFG